MNERSEQRTNATDMEVELDADQLAALARYEAAEHHLATSTPATVVASASVVTSASERKQPNRPTALLRTVVPMSLLVAAVATAGAIYTRTLEPDIVPPAPRSAPAPSVMPETEEIEPQPQTAPVRFTNPFDKREVFEFPAGTSKEEARAAVANILLERASQRRATEPNLRSKRR